MITGVAIKLENEIWSLPKPARHNHVIQLIIEKTILNRVAGIQGFITDKGEFLDRVQGAKYAIGCGQIEKLKWAPNLYSEDLW